MTSGPDFKALGDAIPFGRMLGIEIVAAGPERVVATMPWTEDKTTLGGRLHGGSLMAFADNVGAVCAFYNLPDGATTSTIESKTNFFRGVGSGSVTATSIPLHVGAPPSCCAPTSSMTAARRSRWSPRHRSS
jgi:uncharacterized protein (TIGR00369 family)